MNLGGPVVFVGPTGTFVAEPPVDCMLVMVVPLVLGFGGLPLEAEPEAVVRVMSVGV